MTLHTPRLPIRPRTSRVSGAAIAAIGLTLVLGACGGGGGGDGGGGGGDAALSGTVPDNRALASRELEIRAASGERTTTSIGASGRFAANAVAGSPPFLLRASFGDDEEWYALAETASGTVTNVHAYSDLAIRNFVAVQGGSIDAVFDAEGAVPAGMLPSPSEFAAAGRAIGGILAPSLEAYDLAGVDLSSIAFAAGDQVDAFLDANPAIVEDDTFTILATDQDSGVRTTVANAVALTRDLAAADNVPPAPPSALRALPSASNEIVLVWDAATDDVAVTRYEVRRDGQAVAETPYPVYTDIPLAGGVDYAYAIVAIDEAGNRSDETPPSTARTLEDADTTPPATPTGVQVVVTNASARISWTQDGVADVASFRVRRSVGSGMLAPLAGSTSTALTDVDLSAATEYCYTVTAIDASDNASPPSAEACATTTGTGMITRPPPPGPMPQTPPPDAGDGDAAALLALDVSGLVCEAELESSVVSEALTLDAPCYRLSSGLDIRENGRVTIAAGTVLKFGSNQALDIATGGSLEALGTRSDPIVMTGIDTSPGFWGGVHFFRSNSTRNVLRNVLIEYAGSTNGAALRTSSVSSSLTRLSANSVALRRSAGGGFDLERFTILDAFGDVISTENASSGLVHAEVAASLGADNSYTGNTLDGLELSGGAIASATAWPTIGVPWLVDGLDVSAPFEIPSGAELRFSSGSGIDVGTDGSLRAIGTADAPILLTGTQPTPGFWAGIEFFRSNSADNRLEHVTIEYAGDASSNGAALYSNSFSAGQTRLALTDVTLQFSQGPGFRFDQGTLLSSFERVTSTANRSAGLLHPEALGQLGTTLNLSGNDSDFVALLDASLDQSVTWRDVGVPYTFDQIDVNAALAIEPGVTLIADSGAALDVGTNGSLNAVGTAAAPIRIVGAEPTPGYWNGINFFRSNSTLNRFEHVELRDGGAGTSATSGNIELDCFSALPTQVSIANSTIANSAGWGIYRAAPDCVANLGAGVVFDGNGQGDINPFEP